METGLSTYISEKRKLILRKDPNLGHISKPRNKARLLLFGLRLPRTWRKLVGYILKMLKSQNLGVPILEIGQRDMRHMLTVSRKRERYGYYP